MANKTVLAFCLICICHLATGAPNKKQINAKQGDEHAMTPDQVFPADEMRQILTSVGSARRNQLIKMIADLVKSKTGDCPKSLPVEMCKQPLTFFMWLNEVRNQAKEKEMYEVVRKILVQMLAGKQPV